jgi:hypothetical protein
MAYKLLIREVHMHDYDWFFLAGIACLIFAGELLLASFVGQMLKHRSEEMDNDAYRRAEYQRNIRHCVEIMSDGPEQHEDLEWRLHSLLYEYRHDGQPS